MKQLSSLFFSAISLVILASGVLVVTGHLPLEVPEVFLVFNFPSIAIILGGTFLQLFVSYPVSQIAQGLGSFFPGIYSRKFDQSDRLSEIDQILEWRALYGNSKQNAWPALREQSRSEFEFRIFELLETNYRKDDFVELAYAKLSNMDRQVVQQVKIFHLLSASSPAFGMLGTILGLMVMFNNFENNVELASGIGLALMTTLYGIFFSQFVWIPAARRVNQFHADQRFNYEIMIEGLEMILEEKSSLYIQDYLKAKIQQL